MSWFTWKRLVLAPLAVVAASSVALPAKAIMTQSNGRIASLTTEQAKSTGKGAGKVVYTSPASQNPNAPSADQNKRNSDSSADNPAFTNLGTPNGDSPPMEEPKGIIKRVAPTEKPAYNGLGAPSAMLEALKWMGANAKKVGVPPELWCADFMNLVLRRTGFNNTGSRAARSFLKYGRQVDGPRVGAIAIFTRGKNNGHVGIVRGTDGTGNPIIISGNHGNKVAEAVYPKSRVLAYVVPWTE
jgi:uncharacterized protein (TIGR02594 family)